MKCMPMKLKVRIFEGKSPELYLAVGHFVLSPACLRRITTTLINPPGCLPGMFSTMKTR